MSTILQKDIQNVLNNLESNRRLEQLSELNQKMQIVENQCNEQKSVIDNIAENQKSFNVILDQEKNSLTNSTNIYNTPLQKIKEQISVIDIDPTQAEGGALGYAARLRQVKYIVELSNEIRKQFVGFIEKVVNTSI